MPKVKTEFEGEIIEINFEMYCDMCNKGICNNTHYRTGSENTFVTHCDRCETESREKIEILEGNIQAGEEKIQGLEEETQALEEKNTLLEEEIERLLQTMEPKP